jgi:hypothetical protein
MSGAEKLTEQIKLLVGVAMLDDLKHAAFEADRSVSDYIRHIVALHLYGHVRTLGVCAAEEACCKCS